MEITTERLWLREFAEADAAALIAYQSDPRYTQFYAPGEATPDRARELLRLFIHWADDRPRRNLQLAVAELEEPDGLVGCCGLRREVDASVAEFGIELAPIVWGRGYATEAARAMLGFGFRELRLEEVRAVSVSANRRFVALAGRIGMVEIGSRPGPAWMSARGWSQTEWRLTRAAFETT
ncbi:MAG TPA: GNAT family N-acetyltransferase [Candidatus Limnocylindria bacterium]|nr:GNAT family N-acetyltransferase [Candidatus Limnocylindria bacterium]